MAHTKWKEHTPAAPPYTSARVMYVDEVLGNDATGRPYLKDNCIDIYKPDGVVHSYKTVRAAQLQVRQGHKDCILCTDTPHPIDNSVLEGCGCGGIGNFIVIEETPKPYHEWSAVKCLTCGIQTKAWYTKDHARAYWNRVMDPANKKGTQVTLTFSWDPLSSAEIRSQQIRELRLYQDGAVVQAASPHAGSITVTTLIKHTSAFHATYCSKVGIESARTLIVNVKENGKECVSVTPCTLGLSVNISINKDT